jgi:hypothetical protein
MVPSITQVVFVTSPKALSKPQLPTLLLVCGALGWISMGLTCATWCCWTKDRIQEETSHATWSRCASVEYFCFFLSTHCFEILLLLLFWRGFMIHSFSYAPWLEDIYIIIFIFTLLQHKLFFNDPSLLLQDYNKRNLFVLWSIYFWWMDDMFCVTPGVEVS